MGLSLLLLLLFITATHPTIIHRKKHHSYLIRDPLNNEEYTNIITGNHVQDNDHLHQAAYFSAAAMSDVNINEEEEESYSEDKEQVIAFLYSFFLGGFGAGRFYIGDYGIACAKLIFTLFVFCTVFVCTFFSTKAAMHITPSVDYIDTLNHDYPTRVQFETRTLSGTRATNFRICRPCVGIFGMSFLLSCCGFVTIAIWWIYDVLLFAENGLHDSEGKKLIPWDIDK